MANLRRTDSSRLMQGEAASQAPSKQPIVLARLPRIGAAAVPTHATVTQASPAQTMPAPTVTAPPVPPPESLPQLELRDQISDRIRLHVAEPPTTSSSTSPATHFADRQHAMQAEPVIRQPAPTSKTGSTYTPTSTHKSTRSTGKSHRRTPAPATVSDKLYQLHGSISPYAGLIVAFALIASAALLYRMIVVPTQAPGQLYQDYSNELPREGFGATSQQLPENYLPQFTAELPQADPATSDGWNRLELPALAQPTTAPAQLPKPSWEPASMPPAAAVESSPYPQTKFPEQLDLAKVMRTPMSPPNSDVARGLPEVANRSTESTTR